MVKQILGKNQLKVQFFLLAPLRRNIMNITLYISLLLNLIIIVCELKTLSKIKNKIDIIKYYTYLQNLITLITSIIFSIYLVITIFNNKNIPEFVRGLRYIATCGLTATMFIYVLFLSKNKNNVLTKEDFIGNFNPKIANFILHYFCTIISLLSFIFFEKSIILTDPNWTGYAAIPSCLYWIIYLILSTFNLWKEPYYFTPKKKNILLEIIIMLTIPLSYILISFILWNIK